MPNHCNNEATIRFPSQDEAESFVALIENPDLTHPICDEFLPMPEALHGTSARNLGPSFDHDGLRLAWVNDPDNEHWTPESYEKARQEWHDQKVEQDAAEAATGHKHWYDWATDDANWGTKWGDYDTTVSHFWAPIVDINYTTAWGPLSPSVWKKVSERFPEAQIVVYYTEPGMAFQGSEAYYDGECVHEESGEYRDYAAQAEWALDEHVASVRNSEKG